MPPGGGLNFLRVNLHSLDCDGPLRDRLTIPRARLEA
jgi:hypothetical protein